MDDEGNFYIRHELISLELFKTDESVNYKFPTFSDF